MDHYKFPHIYHIDQVLAAIKGKEEFIVAERDRHTIVNYMVNFTSTFPRVYNYSAWTKMIVPDPEKYQKIGQSYFAREPEIDEDAALLRECRGIVFGPDGTVIARRFHKFFNIGEREENHIPDIGFSQRHVIIEKMDGSMITPIPIYGPGRKLDHIRWGTKMGITGVAFHAEEFVAERPEYSVYAQRCIEAGYTPIFEWCTRKQRIVLDYPKDQLRLLAIRHNITGEYVSYESMWEQGRVFKIPVVASLPDERVTNAEEFIESVKAREDIEGYVIRFADGHMLKVKTDWYCRIHRAKDSLLQEKRVIEMIINEKCDDVLPFLPEHEYKALSTFNEDVLKGILETITFVVKVYTTLYEEGLNRAEFAQDSASVNMNSAHRNLIFNMWGIHPEAARPAALENLKRRILKNLGSQTKVDGIRELWGNHKWTDYIHTQDE